MEGKRRGGGWWALAGLILAPFPLYFLAYFALVTPSPTKVRPFGPALTPRNYIVIEDYRWIGQNRGAIFFWPIHKVDEYWLRPETWDSGYTP